jgi:hypothetical protein
MKTISALVATATLAVSIAAHSAPIRLSFIGTGTDLTLGGIAYSGVNFSVSMTADTNEIDTATSSIPTYDLLTATMSVSGGPTVTFPVYVFDNQNVQGVGFGSAPLNFDLLDLDDSGVGLNTYGLTTAFGPISTSDLVALSQWSDIPTSGGALTVASVDLGTFEATMGSSVPEPGTLRLLALGLAALMLGHRGRRGPA